jgi:antitoxin HicB
MSKHIGSDFDEFLAEDGLREEVTATAIKRVIAWQLAQAMKAKHITRTEMAVRMHTSRAVVNRLLDENDTSVTLATLSRASVAEACRCDSSWRSDMRAEICHPPRAITSVAVKGWYALSGAAKAWLSSTFSRSKAS